MPYWEGENLDEMHALHQRTMSGQAPPEGFETRWRKKDGAVLHVLVVEAPLIDASGQQIGWMGSVLDITERVRAQELEQRRIETMAAQARLTTLGEIASTLAHELNQPLAAIASYNAGLQNALKSRGVTDAPIAQALARQAEQAEHAAAIVHRIRDFLSRREPHREPCDLAALAHQAVQLLRRDLSLRGVRVLSELPDTTPRVVGDRVLLEQVLINLIRNAADALAAPDAGARAQGTVRLQLRVVAGRFVRFDVCDDGPGLKGLGIEQLCQPFFSTKADGMGMGLAICRTIVEAHYGAMDAADLPQGGARISFSLPLAEAQAGVAQAPSDAAAVQDSTAGADAVQNPTETMP
jgi:two-component system sensor histidine kinase DctS